MSILHTCYRVDSVNLALTTFVKGVRRPFIDLPLVLMDTHVFLKNNEELFIIVD